ncbi:MAG: trp RNA-binding attenuation protein MtrB [Christensenellaceae bacterium]|jgi:transcription attenuation protein (tryptophan RNA-binding attenuator protein)
MMVESEFVLVKALEDGVSLIGMTRGDETKLQHTEKIDAGEVIVAQFTENISAMKIRGKALVQTRHGTVFSGTDEA